MVIDSFSGDTRRQGRVEACLLQRFHQQSADLSEEQRSLVDRMLVGLPKAEILRILGEAKFRVLSRMVTK